MPEYLAPAVYVEETSFRSKPLEGVSTSTTAFVGLTRRGPVTTEVENLSDEERELITPELVTSVPDFERLYGGTTPLQHVGADERTNYLAQAVRGFFANGGRRLYVARVFRRSVGTHGRAASRFIVGADGDPVRARFEARTPGAAGNGRITVTQLTAPATPNSLNNALEGTMIRTGAQDPRTPSTGQGGVPDFRVGAGAEFALDVDGNPFSITFEGRRAQVSTPAGLPEPVVIAAGEADLEVTVNGLTQTVSLPVGNIPRTELALRLNEALQGGAFATLTAGDELVIGSEIEGADSRVAVAANPSFGFPADAADDASVDSNVANLNAVTANEINGLLAAAAAPVDVSLDPATLRLVLTTQSVGAGSLITVVDPGAGNSAHAALGFTLGAQTPGQDGQVVQYYVKTGSAWLDAGDNPGVFDPMPDGGVEFVSINVEARDADGFRQNFEDLALSPAHPSYIGAVIAPMPARRRSQLENLVALVVEGNVTPFQLREGLLGAAGVGGANPEQRVAVALPMTGGNDGDEPSAEEFREALNALDALEGVSIVAAPGSSANPAHAAIRNHVITHVEQRRAYKIAVLDPPEGQTLGEVRGVRASFDSRYAALYYPWLVVPNPDSAPGNRSRPAEIRVPPSGHICGVYARSDAERGVHKAPANEVLRGVTRFETNINMRQQEALNPEGINALRSFPGRGNRIWGARLASSDPELKYVNVRRYLNYIAATLDRGTQWVVFEPNGELLWARVRSTVRDFLYNEWVGGALLGSTQDEAFSARCDRSIMTQNDLDNGRLVCEVGMAIVKPAEFVIFRIGQKTANANG
ncbi:MAG: phage tail sheath subtilisin-like domain-containing protein [Myxococcota bacterium]